MLNSYLHEVAITAIILRTHQPAHPKFLIIRRSTSKKRFPGKWTVPGGKLETKDYLGLPKDTQDYWYNVLEKTLATVHSDGAPSLVISCLCEWKKGKVKLQEEETDQFAWVTLKEAKKYDLLDGIYEELIMAEKKLQGKKVVWKRD